MCCGLLCRWLTFAFMIYHYSVEFVFGVHLTNERVPTYCTRFYDSYTFLSFTMFFNMGIRICSLFVINTLLYLPGWVRTEDPIRRMTTDTARFRLLKRQVPYGFPANFQSGPESHFGMSGPSATPRNDIESVMMRKLDAMMQEKMLEKFNAEMEAKLKEFNAADNNSKNSGNGPIHPNSGALGTTFFVGNNRSMAAQPASDMDASGPLTSERRAIPKQPTNVYDNPVRSSSNRIDSFEHANQQPIQPTVTPVMPSYNGWNPNRQGRSEQTHRALWSNMQRPYSFYDKGRLVAAKFGFLYPDSTTRTGPKIPEKRANVIADPLSQKLRGRSEPDSARSDEKGHQRTRFSYL